MTFPRPRRPTRRERRDGALRLTQLIRLAEIAEGRRAPRFPREEMYARARAMGLRPDPDDFVLPAPLAWLELRLAGAEPPPAGAVSGGPPPSPRGPP